MSLELIQIIEPDQEQAAALDHVLRKASFRTSTAFDGQTGLQDVWKTRPSLVVLDLMVPGIGGKTLCRQLREDPQTASVGIIVVTGLPSEQYRIAALESGADDVLAKPYSAREIVARIQAVLRRLRAAPVDAGEDLDGDLTLTQMQYAVRFRGLEAVLTAGEWTLLHRLAKSPNKVVPMEELRALLWGNDGLEHGLELDRIVQSLSKKLVAGSGAGPVIGLTPGAGYRLLGKGVPFAQAA